MWIMTIQSLHLKSIFIDTLIFKPKTLIMILKTKKNTKRLKASVYAFLFAASAFAQNANPIPQSYENAAMPDSAKNAQLEEVSVTGTRAQPRTKLTTAVPVDVVDMAKLSASAPQVSVADILNYVAPSFSSNKQSIQDGTDHIDPASLRGMGVDQVLVLVNGKRLHQTSLVNFQVGPGRGQVGTDLNTIPTAAIERIEILRDGAAAQYGSDAIAGVINIILKKATNQLHVNVTSGANFTDDASLSLRNKTYDG